MASLGAVANSCYKLLISSLLLHLVGFPCPGSKTYVEAALESSDSAGYTAHVKPIRNDPIKGAFERVTMEAGYMVSPARYGDNKTRFYTRWEKVAANGTRTGCFDLDCKGFIPTQSGGQYIGTPIGTSQAAAPESIGRGRNLQIQQQANGDWLLRRDGLVIGNWPSSLFESSGNTSPTSEIVDGLFPFRAAVEVINEGLFVYISSFAVIARDD